MTSNNNIDDTKNKIAKCKDNSFLKSTVPVSRVFGLDRGKPIDRLYIEQFILESKDEIQHVSCPFRILEVGERTYSKFISKELHLKDVSSDVLNYKNGEDLTKKDTLKKDAYNLFICTQTFNFIYDVKKAIEGAYYMLAPGGMLLATVAGSITPISRYDMDRWGHFWGFTNLSANLMFSEVFGESNVEVFSYGNALSATAFVQGLAIEDFEDMGLLTEKDEDYQILIGIRARKR